MRVVLDEEVEGLGEGQRHHGEGDTVNTKSNRSKNQSQDQGDTRRERQCGHERPVPSCDGDVKDVGASGKIQNGAQRQETGESEHKVVAEGHPGEHEAQREHLEGSGRVHDIDRARQNPWDVQAHKR